MMCRFQAAACAETAMIAAVPRPSSQLGSRYRLGESTLAQQRIRARQPAAEGLVGFGRITCAAGRIDVVMQPLRRRRVEYVAGFLECFERIGVEHFRPHVAVVAGRIAAAGEDMSEMR